jgi:hypothetical protein
MKRLANVYLLFHHHGKVTEVNESDFLKLTSQLSPQWEDEVHEFGKWYLPVLPDEMVSVTETNHVMFIEPKDNAEENSKGWGINVKVSDILNDTIYGPCFLQPYNSELEMVKRKFL